MFLKRMPLKCKKDMAEKQDIAMNQFQIVTDVTYLYGEATDSSQGKIKKSTFLDDILCVRSGFLYNDQEHVDNLKKPGMYSHGDPIIGTGIYGGHGLLLVLHIGDYTIQIDFPIYKDYILFRKCYINNWSEWKSVTLT